MDVSNLRWRGAWGDTNYLADTVAGIWAFALGCLPALLQAMFIWRHCVHGQFPSHRILERCVRMNVQVIGKWFGGNILPCGSDIARTRHAYVSNMRIAWWFQGDWLLCEGTLQMLMVSACPCWDLQILLESWTCFIKDSGSKYGPKRGPIFWKMMQNDCMRSDSL